MADHGISDQDLETIRTVLRGSPEAIEEVALFGSRATGRHRRNSDIDLVVYGPVTPATIGRLRGDFEESDLPVSVDVVSYNAIQDLPLRRHMDTVRRPLFTAEELRNSHEAPRGDPGAGRSGGDRLPAGPGPGSAKGRLDGR